MKEAKDERLVFNELADQILNKGFYKAVMFLNETLTVKATKKRFKKGSNEKFTEIIFTVGPPNYGERETIKIVKKNWIGGKLFPFMKVYQARVKVRIY